MKSFMGHGRNTNINIDGSDIENPSFTVVNERISYFKLLFRWKGSIWKLLFWDLIVFIVLYYIVSIVYKCYFMHHKEHKKVMDSFITYLNSISQLMPMTFLLGFFVSTVLSRYWTFIGVFPWLTGISVLIQGHIRSKEINREDMEIMLKEAFCRYITLAWILAFRTMSYLIQSRFKTSEPEKCHICPFTCSHKVHSINNLEPSVREVMTCINKDPVIKEEYGNLVTEEEIQLFEEFERYYGSNYALDFWIPLRWCVDLTSKAGELGCLYDPRSHMSLIEGINTIRGSLGTMLNTYRFNIPLVYTQAIIIIVYSNFISEVFNHNFMIDPVDKKPRENVPHDLRDIDLFLPFVSLMRFILFMGWFKIGLSLINPLREDQSHYPTSEILDYNLKFMRGFTLTRSQILPRSIQLSGYNLKVALQKDTKEIHSKSTDSNEAAAH